MSLPALTRARDRPSDAFGRIGGEAVELGGRDQADLDHGAHKLIEPRDTAAFTPSPARLGAATRSSSSTEGPSRHHQSPGSDRGRQIRRQSPSRSLSAERSRLESSRFDRLLPYTSHRAEPSVDGLDYMASGGKKLVTGVARRVQRLLGRVANEFVHIVSRYLQSGTAELAAGPNSPRITAASQRRFGFSLVRNLTMVGTACCAPAR